MQFTTPENLSYCAKQAFDQRRDWFWVSLYAPPAAREALYALYALDIELSHVHHVVPEEMIGHIRYAWWAERIEALAHPPQGHPVLQALKAEGLTPQLLLPLVESYRETFPELPENVDALVQNIACEIMAAHECTKWKRAQDIITKHQLIHGARHKNWLLLKLIFV